VAGLRIEAIDAGARLRLRNATGQEVVVLGYAGEPYLRVGPAGVFENRRSRPPTATGSDVSHASSGPGRPGRAAAVAAPGRG